jgi:hypothetical protein
VVDAAWKAPGVNRVRRPPRRRGHERPGVAPHGERAARFAARRGGTRTLRVDGHPAPVARRHSPSFGERAGLGSARCW